MKVRGHLITDLFGNDIIIHLLVKETSDKYKMKGSRYQKWNKSTLKKRIINLALIKTLIFVSSLPLEKWRNLVITMPRVKVKRNQMLWLAGCDIKKI